MNCFLMIQSYVLTNLILISLDIQVITEEEEKVGYAEHGHGTRFHDKGPSGICHGNCLSNRQYHTLEDT